MNEFLASLKSDLLDRRFLPVLALLGVALLAALAFAVLGGGSSTSPAPSPQGSASTGVTGAAGAIAISPAPANPKKAVAETTSGANKSSGTPRNPFTPLPSAKAQTTTSSSSSSTKTSTSTSSSGTSGGAGPTSAPTGSSSPSPSPKPSKPNPKPAQKIYHVNVLFGVAPAGTPPPNIPLTPFNDLTRLSPLTAGGQAPLVYAGATARGAGAIFTVVQEVFLHGPAICHPSASQCQAIQLKPGQSEELEYVPIAGPALVYRLELVSVTAVHASAAKAAGSHRATSPAGRALLRSAGLSALPGLRYSTRTGLVTVSRTRRRPFAARAASRHR
jgi:hypothetical protein